MRQLLFSTTILAVAAAAGVAQAQAVAQLDEVVVTAERRSTNVQDTPLSITALTGNSLAERGIENLSNISALVPSLQTGDSGQIYLRGIGSTNLNETGDPALAVQLDGIYLARSSSLNGLFYDVDRVEVLRGPQGTLYGRNATAGVVNVISRRPVIGQFAGSVAADVGNYKAVKANAMLNIPVSDQFALRAALQTVDHDPYVENVGNPIGSDAYDQHDKSARLSALWKPTDGFNWYVSVDWLHRTGHPGFAANSNATSTVDEITGVPAHPRTITTPLTTSMDDDYFGVTSEVNWNLGPGTLTYLAGYRSEERNERNRALVNTGLFNLALYRNDEWTASHELRYALDFEKLKWVVGLYGFDEHNSVDFRTGLPAGFLAPGAATRQFLNPVVRASSRAAFTQGTYSFTPQLRVTAGVRTTEDKKSRFGEVNFVNGFTGAFVSRTSLNSADYSFNNTSWRLGVDYDLSPEVLLFANVATGYKAGGYFDGDQRAGIDNSYDPESLINYEAGIKSRFLDNRLQLNLSAFRYDYSDFQVSSQILFGGQPAGSTVNADKAELYGVELEATWLVSEAGKIELTGGYLHAEYTDFFLANGDGFSNAGRAATAPRAPVNFSGTTMAKSPEWSATLAYEHKWILGDAALTGRVQTHYESKNILEQHAYAATIQPSFTRTDLSLTYAHNGKWTIMGYVRNIEDDDVKTFAVPQVPATAVAPTVFAVQYASPRLYGVRLGIDF